MFTNSLVLKLRADQDTNKQIRIIPHPIINDVLDRAKRVGDDHVWLSNMCHIQSPIPTAARARGLITGFFPISLTPSKPRTEPLLPLHTVMSPRAMTPENRESIVPSTSVAELPDLSVPAPAEDPSTEASGISGNSVHSEMRRMAAPASNPNEVDNEWNSGRPESGTFHRRTP